MPINQILREKFDATFSGLFTVADSKLIIGTDNQSIVCFDYPSLNVRWAAAVSHIVAEDLFLQDGKIIIKEWNEEGRLSDMTVRHLDSGEIFKSVTLPTSTLLFCPQRTRLNCCIMYDFDGGQGLHILDLSTGDWYQRSTPENFCRAIWDDELLLFYTYDERFCHYDVNKREFSSLQPFPITDRYKWTAVLSATQGKLILGGSEASTLDYTLCRWNYLSGKTDIFWKSSIDEIFPESLMETLGIEPLPNSLKELVIRENEGGWITFLEHIANLYWVENQQTLLCSLGGEGQNLAGDSGANTVCLIDTVSGKLISKILTETRDSGDMRMLPAAPNEWLMSTGSSLWQIFVSECPSENETK